MTVFPIAQNYVLWSTLYVAIQGIHRNSLYSSAIDYDVINIITVLIYSRAAYNSK